MAQRIDYQKVSAGGMRALGGVHQYIASCGLPRTLVDLVYLRVSQINGCAYCVSTHTKDLERADVPTEKLALLPVWRESGAWFSDNERAALAWAESVTRINETHAGDADYTTAVQQLGEKNLVDLTIAIALINAYNRVAISFRQGPAQPSIGVERNLS